VEVAQGLNAQGSCNGGGNNGGGVGIGFHTIVPFTVTCADTYHFRFHTDYGRGGFIGVNDDAQLSNTQASSASGSATDIWGHVEVNDIPLTAGDHVFEGLGFEGCCDGAQEMDVRLPTGTDWIRVTTGASDGLTGACAGGSSSSNADVTVVSTTGVSGKTTVRLTMTLPDGADNVYAMAGTADTTMAFPAAFQVAAPFGADTGGVSPAFFAFSAEAEFDSWLTIGITDGSSPGAITVSPGADGADAVAAWSETQGIETANGAVFWMDPNASPGGADPIVLAQITSAEGGTASALLQGQNTDGSTDWTQEISWSW
jgi:hypothetical protein